MGDFTRCRCGIALNLVGPSPTEVVWWCDHCDSTTPLIPGGRHPAHGGNCPKGCLWCRNLAASVKRIDLRRWPDEPRLPDPSTVLDDDGTG